MKILRYVAVSLVCGLLYFIPQNSVAEQYDLTNCPCYDIYTEVIQETNCVDDLGVQVVLFVGGHWGWWVGNGNPHVNFQNHENAATDLGFLEGDMCVYFHSTFNLPFEPELDNYCIVSEGFLVEGDCQYTSSQEMPILALDEQRACQDLLFELYDDLYELGSCN